MSRDHHFPRPDRDFDMIVASDGTGDTTALEDLPLLAAGKSALVKGSFVLSAGATIANDSQAIEFENVSVTIPAGMLFHVMQNMGKWYGSLKLTCQGNTADTGAYQVHFDGVDHSDFSCCNIEINPTATYADGFSVVRFVSCTQSKFRLRTTPALSLTQAATKVLTIYRVANSNILNCFDLDIDTVTVSDGYIYGLAHDTGNNYCNLYNTHIRYLTTTVGNNGLGIHINGANNKYHVLIGSCYGCDGANINDTGTGTIKTSLGTSNP